MKRLSLFVSCTLSLLLLTACFGAPADQETKDGEKPAKTTSKQMAPGERPDIRKLITEDYCDNLFALEDVKEYIRIADAKTDEKLPLYIRPRVDNTKEGKERKSDEGSCRWAVPEGYYRENCENMGPDNNFFDFSCADHALQIDFDCHPEELEDKMTALEMVEDELDDDNRTLSHGDLTRINDSRFPYAKTGQISMAKGGCYIEARLQLVDKYREMYTAEGGKAENYTEEEQAHIIESLETIASEIDAKFP